MVVYFDSSALVKRVLDESHTGELVDRIAALERGGNELITSTLGWVEVTRALKNRAQQLAEDSLGDFDAKALAGISAFPMSYEVVSLARRIGPRTLRSLDAIHCATATLVDAGLVVTYDDRLASAAGEIGLPVESPGVSR